jgi:predicted O-methyltransferase YrrM
MHALEVPGWMHPQDLDAIRCLARSIPASGIVVEVGSWLGQSTCAWAEHTTATIYCIDLWEWMPESYTGANASKVDLTADPFPQFQANVSRYSHVVPLRRTSNGIPWEYGPIDLVFIDAMHQEPYVEQDIRFWEPFVKPGGIICGDDYSDYFPAVQKAAHNCALRLHKNLALPGHKFWYIIK